MLFAGIAGGTPTALTASLSPAITGYTNGLTVSFLTGATANTGDSTLAVNGLAATQILLNGLVLDAGDLPANTVMRATFYNSKWHLFPAPQAIGSQLLSGLTNLIDNGNGIVCQDIANGGTITGIADNGHGIDRYRVLSNGGTVNMLGAVFTNLPTMAESAPVVQTGTINVKFGVIQIVPSTRVKRLRGRPVTVSGKLSVNAATMGNMKVGIMEWTGAADTTTADPISAWNADGVTPTLIANWAFLNTPANLSVVTGSFPNATPFSITATVGAAAANLAIFIWNDDATVAVNDLFQYTNLQLNEGRVALPFDVRPFEVDLNICRAFYRKSFPKGTAPATNAGLTGSIRWRAINTAATATEAPMILWDNPMFATPVVTIYNPSVANNQIRNVTDGADFSASSAVNITADGFTITGTGSAGTTPNEQLAVHYMADARL